MEGSFSYRSQPRRYGKPLVRLNVTEDYGWSARRDHIYPSSAHLREKNFSKGSIRSPDQCASTSVGQSVSDAAGRHGPTSDPPCVPFRELRPAPGQLRMGEVVRTDAWCDRRARSWKKFSPPHRDHPLKPKLRSVGKRKAVCDIPTTFFFCFCVALRFRLLDLGMC